MEVSRLIRAMSREIEQERWRAWMFLNNSKSQIKPHFSYFLLSLSIVPEKVRRKEPWNAKACIRAMEQYTRDVGGYVRKDVYFPSLLLYLSLILNRPYFWINMFEFEFQPFPRSISLSLPPFQISMPLCRHLYERGRIPSNVQSHALRQDAKEI